MEENIMTSVFDVRNIPLYCDSAKNGTVIAFDTETTGLTDDDDVVQLAVVLMKSGKIEFSKAVYLKNQIPIDGTEAQQVNGITDAILSSQGMNPKEVLDDFILLLKNVIAEEGKVVLVAHNCAFDIRMVTNMMRRYGCDGFPDGVVPCCTRDFVKSLCLPKNVLGRNTLKNCIEVFNLDAENTHDACDDAKACLELFRFLTN